MNTKTMRRLSILLCLALVLAMLPVTAMAADTQTIYFNAGGASLWDQAGAWFCAWAWGDGVEGQWATATYSEGEGIYWFDVPAGATSIKFLRMSPDVTEPNWDNGVWNQTDDLTISGDYYTITGWGGTDGKWSTHGDITPEETTQATESTEATYIVAGSSADVFGTAWDPANTANTMTLVDGLYTITYADVATNFEFKVTDGTWTNAWPSQNYLVEITAVSDVTITFNPGDKSVNVEVTVVGEELPEVEDNYVLCGTLPGLAWDPADTADSLTKNEDGTYSMTIASVAAGDYKIKVTKNGTWTASVGGNCDADGNFGITVGTACDVTVTYYADSKLIDVTGDGVVKNYYVAGSDTLTGSNWVENDANNQMTLNEAGTMYVKEYTNVAAGDYQLKVTQGVWTAPSYGDANTESGNYEVTVYEDGSTVTVYFMPSSSYVLIDVQAPAVEDETSELVLGDNTVAVGSYTYTATQSGILNIAVTTLKQYDEYSGEWMDGTDYIPGQFMRGTYELHINGQNVYSYTGSVQISAGDVITVDIVCYMGYTMEATLNLSVEGYKVKYQVTQGADATADSVNVRFLTSVDSLDYKSITFTIEIEGQTYTDTCTTVYESLIADGVTIDDASTVFGEGAAYFAAFTMTGVSQDYYSSDIVVTVTWTDLEGNETTATRTINLIEALA